MPPKPKGLKASKRAAPFDPSAAPEPTTGPALNKEGTMPLDEDALTVADLFELASRVLEILYPFPTSLRFEPVEPAESGAEDARNLLRGILHGCDVLEPYLSDQDRRAEMDQDKLDALGLADAGVAAVQVRYLQAFALRHLGELFQPAPPVAVVAGSKRRKVDLREPQSASEWFEAAEERLSGETGTSDSILAVLLAAERAHLSAVSSSPDLSELEDRLAGVVAALCALEPESTSPTSTDVSEAWYAALRALTAGVVALEGIRDPDALCAATASSVDVPLCSSFSLVGVEPPSPVLDWLRAVVAADVQLARFGIAEDWIEARYRADADDEEQGDVAALPDEAKPFVEVVREYGRQGAFFVFSTGSLREADSLAPTAITSLRSTLAGEVPHPSARTAQYRKARRFLSVFSPAC